MKRNYGLVILVTLFCLLISSAAWSELSVAKPEDVKKTQVGKEVYYTQDLVNFSQFITKFRLDNKAVRRNLYFNGRYHHKNCHWVSRPTTYWDSIDYRPQPKI